MYGLAALLWGISVFASLLLADRWGPRHPPSVYVFWGSELFMLVQEVLPAKPSPQPTVSHAMLSWAERLFKLNTRSGEVLQHLKAYIGQERPIRSHLQMSREGEASSSTPVFLIPQTRKENVTQKAYT